MLYDAIKEMWERKGFIVWYNRLEAEKFQADTVEAR